MHNTLQVIFVSWESRQTLPALFIGPFEYVERFRNLKFVVKRITNIQSTVLGSSEEQCNLEIPKNHLAVQVYILKKLAFSNSAVSEEMA